MDTLLPYPILLGELNPGAPAATGFAPSVDSMLDDQTNWMLLVPSCFPETRACGRYYQTLTLTEIEGRFAAMVEYAAQTNALFTLLSNQTEGTAHVQ